ncbi:MAG: D-glycero-beta-D-manno-heptose-7-phosphate kinase [Flavobacteriales bacterium]|nr:D-glycero-beta-D-manno-heptose-7-phosphate kinase [Flavobacteriales bacterium]
MEISKAELNTLFENFNQLNILIIGDVMIDSYYWGKVDRISPEAPVPIVAVRKRESRLGGAANVALNIKALGATPILCSVIGADEDGNELISLLKENNQTTEGILKSENRRTTKKTRIIGNNHQMLRIDGEDLHDLSNTEEDSFFENIQHLIKSKKIDAIIFEDYDKGSITSSLIEKVVVLAHQESIPTAVDPKKNNFINYKNVSLFKPNLKELKEGLKLDFDHKIKTELETAIQQLEETLNNTHTLITLSESGIFIKSPKEKHHIKAHLRDITDVSGAGDTVISVASLCLALKQRPELIAQLSNLAGGLVCENVGVVPINKVELLEEAIRVFI